MLFGLAGLYTILMSMSVSEWSQDLTREDIMKKRNEKSDFRKIQRDQAIRCDHLCACKCLSHQSTEMY